MKPLVALSIGGLPRSVPAINGVVTVNFAGIPGLEYDVQHSTNLVDWIIRNTLIAPSNGLFFYMETNSPLPSFYRLMQH